MPRYVKNWMRQALWWSNKSTNKQKYKEKHKYKKRNVYDELGLRPVLWGSHKVTLVTAMEKTEIEKMSCHHHLTVFRVTACVSIRKKNHSNFQCSKHYNFFLINRWIDLGTTGKKIDCKNKLIWTSNENVLCWEASSKIGLGWTFCNFSKVNLCCVRQNWT